MHIARQAVFYCIGLAIKFLRQVQESKLISQTAFTPDNSQSSIGFKALQRALA